MTIVRARLDTARHDVATLVDAVRGTDAKLPRGHAMSLLLGARYPGAGRVLQGIVEDAREPAEVRAIAVRHLGLLPPCTVQDFLVRNLATTQDERVLHEIVRVLGRIGDGEALPAIEKLARHGSTAVSRAADFAGLLVAYRCGREEGKYPPPDNVESVPVPSGCAANARCSNIGPREFVACVESLGQESFGIEYAERGATRIDFEGVRWVILFEREIMEGEGLDALRGSNRLLAVVAEQDPKDDSYYPLLVILSTPGQGGRAITLQGYDLGGDLQYVGRGTISPGELRFAIRTVSRTTLTLEAEGSIQEGKLRLEHLRYSPRLAERLIPARR